MTSEVFADGVGEITIIGTTLRIDLVSLSPNERDAAGNQLPIFRQRVVMPTEGFMNAFELMERVANELVRSGAVQRRPQEGAASAPQPIRRGGSPNFE
jgi:hypothetical protein